MKLEITVNNKLCKSLEEIKDSVSDEFYRFVCEFLDDNDYVVAHTSGSTGKPKMIKLNKQDMILSANNTNEYFNLSSDSLFYLNLSPNYIAGKMMIVRALVLNAKIIEEAPSNNPLADYNGERIDLASFVPSQLISLFNNPDRLQYISRMIIGGGEISLKLRKKIVDYGLDAYATYGMTETCSHVALSPIVSENLPYSLLGDITATVDADDCLQLSLQAYSIKNLSTNDVVNLVDEKHFYWKGRKDNVINSGGIKIHPEEIEPQIAKILPRLKFFVFGQKSEK